LSFLKLISATMRVLQIKQVVLSGDLNLRDAAVRSRTREKLTRPRSMSADVSSAPGDSRSTSSAIPQLSTTVLIVWSGAETLPNFFSLC
jgi:hypothetical protein